MKYLALSIWILYLFFIFVVIPYGCIKVDNFLGWQLSFPPFLKILGFILILFGFLLGFWCFVLFWVKGKGTPLFLYPPKELVTEGPYQFSRNPMMLGAWLIYGGEVLILKSLALLIFFLLFVIPISILWVIKYEEPYLERTFKERYLTYKTKVRRWV